LICFSSHEKTIEMVALLTNVPFLILFSISKSFLMQCPVRVSEVLMSNSFKKVMLLTVAVCASNSCQVNAGWWDSLSSVFSGVTRDSIYQAVRENSSLQHSSK
jgi:hypothetical protein